MYYDLLLSNSATLWSDSVFRYGDNLGYAQQAVLVARVASFGSSFFSLMQSMSQTYLPFIPVGARLPCPTQGIRCVQAPLSIQKRSRFSCKSASESSLTSTRMAKKLVLAAALSQKSLLSAR